MFKQTYENNIMSIDLVLTCFNNFLTWRQLSLGGKRRQIKCAINYDYVFLFLISFDWSLIS